MQRHAAPAYAFCAQPLAPVSCIHSLKPAPLHAMLSCCGGGDGGGGGDGLTSLPAAHGGLRIELGVVDASVVLRRHQAELVEERADRSHVVEEAERLAVDDVVVRGACVDRHFLPSRRTPRTCLL